MARISKQPEERRREIIGAARKYFCEKGFEDTQMADVSKELNVAQGLIYHYFSSKTELLYAVIEQISEENATSAMSLINNCGGTAFECFKLLVLHKMEDHQNYQELETGLRDNPSLLEFARNKMMDSSLSVVEDLIHRGNEDGSCDCSHPKESAVFIIGGLSKLSQFRDNADFHAAVEELLARALGAPRA